MSTGFYALHESTNIIVAEKVTPSRAARKVDTSQRILLADPLDLQALARSSNKLLYIPLLHSEDAGLDSLAGVA